MKTREEAYLQESGEELIALSLKSLDVGDIGRAVGAKVDGLQQTNLYTQTVMRCASADESESIPSWIFMTLAMGELL